MIDPQKQASNWIQLMTGKDNLVYLKKDMIDIELQLLIENSLQFGN